MIRLLCTAALLAALLTPSLGTAQTGAEPPEQTTGRPKVLLIGLDGVSLNLLVPLTEAGVTPNLGKLMKNGSRGHLRTIWPMRTPQVWTTAVTGKLPGQHGVWDHVTNSYFNPPEVRTGDKQVVTTKERKSKALWNLLAEKDKKSLVVGWVPSWPAEAVPGSVIAAPIELMGDPRQTTIKGSFWRGEKDQFHPKRLEKKVRKKIVHPGELTPAELAAFAELPDDGAELYAQVKYLDRYVYALKWSLARAKSVENLTLALSDEVDADLTLAYFQCTDSLLHRFWIFHKSEADIRERFETHGLDPAPAAELKRRFEHVVEACYRDTDARVGRLLEKLGGEDVLVMIISDHGFGHAPVPHKLKGEPYSGDHLDDGVLLARGPGVKAGAEVKGATITDVTPTLLYYLGLPVGDDMRGRVLEGLFTDAWKKTHPESRIPTWENSPQLEVLYPDGFPPRNIPMKPAAGQMDRGL